jgi:hypothetical protein
MKRVLLSFFLFSGFVASAQRTIDVDKDNVNVSNLIASVGGEPVVMAKFTRLVSGTPFFKDEFLNGHIVLPAGQEIKGVKVKLDLYNNEVHYLNEKEEELVATLPVKEVLLEKNGSIYRFISATGISPSAKKGWYQVLLQNNNIALYKLYGKQLSSNKPYGSATEEQTMNTTEHFFVHENNALLELKRLKDAPLVLASKKSQIESWLKNEDDKNATAERRMIALVSYYASLSDEQK